VTLYLIIIVGTRISDGIRQMIVDKEIWIVSSSLWWFLYYC